MTFFPGFEKVPFLLLVLLPCTVFPRGNKDCPTPFSPRASFLIKTGWLLNIIVKPLELKFWMVHLRKVLLNLLNSVWCFVQHRMLHTNSKYNSYIQKYKTFCDVQNSLFLKRIRWELTLMQVNAMVFFNYVCSV